LPLLKRKAQLQKLLARSTRIRYLAHVGEDGQRLYAAAAQLELEGIVAKRSDAPYRRGRSADWIKIKTPVGRAIDEERAKWGER
jgi:bifunctional non-homologous end joining protein LigD